MIRYKLLLLSLLILGTLAMSGCASTPTVYSDFDQRHDFTQDKTFSWVDDKPMLRAGSFPVSAIAEQRMTNAIKNTMIAKGYLFVENADEADLSLVYTMGARKEIEIVNSSSGYYRHRTDWGWGAYYFPYFVHFPFGSYPHSRRFEYPRMYTQGTIALDIFNAKTKTPVWHSKASKRLSRKDLGTHARNADKIATQLLKHFPEVGCEVEVTPECQPFN